MRHSNQRSWFSIVAPGILLAATGVGARDLMTTSLAGSEVGLGLLWAVVVGAALKFALSEGVARWQLATGSTLLEGWVSHLGTWIRWVFLAYLLLFTAVVGGALVTACGIAGAALVPLGDAGTSKIVWGIAHSLLGLTLVWYGSFHLFEKLMSVLIGIMFVTVVMTALVIGPDWGAVAQGFVPSIPASGVGWLLAVLGGVGGTVTLLSYGYWIREEGRSGLKDVVVCRVDLAVGNGITAIFGLSALIIGSRVQLEGDGSTLALQLADQLAAAIGPWGKWIFLIGFWGAVFSSLLGVWQSIPYMFADFLELSRAKTTALRRTMDPRQTRPYRLYLVLISIVSIGFLWVSVKEIQFSYGIIGACFLPLLALTLLLLNSRKRWVGSEFVSPWVINAVLVLALLFFGYAGGREIYTRLQQLLWPS